MRYSSRFCRLWESFWLYQNQNSLLYQKQSGFVLDKNYQSKINDFDNLKTMLLKNTLNSITCPRPFLKINFVTRLMNDLSDPIIYLDFDLLYSGYAMAGIIPKHHDILFQPSKESWKTVFENMVSDMCKKKSFLIIDSLNGFFSLFYDKGSGRRVTSYIMLLANIAEIMGSHIVVINMTESAKNAESFTIPFVGHQIIDTETISKLSF